MVWGFGLDLYDAIANVRSIRQYEDRFVEKEKLDRILDAARLAPSAMNRQPYRLFIISNKDVLTKISSACSQDWKAPIMIAAVAQPKEAWVRGDGEEYWKTDTAILLHNVSLAAFAEGLGTCWIAAFDEKKVKEILGLGLDSRVLFLSPLGYSTETKGPIRNRKKLEAIVTYL